MAEYEVPEKTKSRHERVVGLIIAAIAVVLAIVSSIGHDTQNEEILAHVDAADQFAFYQAKKARSFDLKLHTDAIGLERGLLSAAAQTQADKLVADYAAIQTRLDGEGRAVQAEGEGRLKEAAHLGRKAQVIDVGETALQIAIVLCSITILTEQRLFTIMGVITAAAGTLVALWGVLLG